MRTGQEDDTAFSSGQKNVSVFQFYLVQIRGQMKHNFLFAGRCDDFSRALGIHRVPYEHETDIEADTVNTRNQRLKNKTKQKYPVQTHFS